MTEIRDIFFGSGQSKVFFLCILALVVAKTVNSEDIELLKLFGRVNITENGSTRLLSNNAQLNHTTVRGVEKTATNSDERNLTPTERLTNLAMNEANMVRALKPKRHGRVKRDIQSSLSFTAGDIDRMVSKAADKALHIRPNDETEFDDVEKPLNEVSTIESLNTRYGDQSSLEEESPLLTSLEADNDKSVAKDAFNMADESLPCVDLPVRKKFPDLLGNMKDITLRDLDDKELEKGRVAMFTNRKIWHPVYKHEAMQRELVDPLIWPARSLRPEEDIDFGNVREPIIQKVRDPTVKVNRGRKPKLSEDIEDTKQSRINYFVWITLPSMIGIVSIIFIFCMYMDPEGKRYDEPPDLVHLKDGETSDISDGESVDRESVDDEMNDIVIEEETVASETPRDE